MSDSSYDKPRTSAAEAIAAYRVKTQWVKGRSGNPSGKKKNQSAKTLKELVMKVASKTITLSMPDGQTKKMNHAEALLFSVLRRAAAKDAAASKIVLKWLKEYANDDQYLYEKPYDGSTAMLLGGQDLIDQWHAAEYFPPGCPKNVMEIDDDTLNDAFKLSQKAYRREQRLKKGTPEIEILEDESEPLDY